MKTRRALLWALVAVKGAWLVLLVVDRVSLRTSSSTPTIAPATTRTTSQEKEPPTTPTPNPALRSEPFRRAAPIDAEARAPNSAPALGWIVHGRVTSDSGQVIASPRVEGWHPTGGPAASSWRSFADGRFVVSLPERLEACNLRIQADGHMAARFQIERPQQSSVVSRDIELQAAPQSTALRILDKNGNPVRTLDLPRHPALPPYSTPSDLFTYSTADSSSRGAPPTLRSFGERFDWSSGTATAEVRGDVAGNALVLLFGGQMIDEQPWTPGQLEVAFAFDPTTGFLERFAQLDVHVRSGPGMDAAIAGASVSYLGLATTDAAGHATLTVPPGLVALDVTAPGYPRWRQSLAVRAGEQREVLVELPTLRTLEGRLLTAEGEPWPGRSLDVRAERAPASSVAWPTRGSGHGESDSRIAVAEDGTFSARVPSLPLSLQARHRTRFGQAIVRHFIASGSGDQRNLELRATPAATLRVTRPEGSLRDDVRYVLRSAAGELLETKTMPGGWRFQVPLGPMTLEVHAPGRPAEVHRLDITDLRYGHRLELR